MSGGQMEVAADTLRRWRERPDIMVRELFGATPDPWQDDALRAFPTTPRIAMKASKGPGKTATLAWLAWNFLLTRPHPNISATSVSGANLRDNLWKEMAVWRNKSKLLQAKFEWTGERIFNKEHPATWWMSARTWSQAADKEQLGNTLAGLHSEYVMAIMDESGGMPTAITASAEGIFSGSNEAHIIQAGNTNSLEGALYEACVKNKALWKVIVISGDPDDPKRSSRVPIEWARDMIKAYGRDSPFIKVMLLGEWPAASINALIGPDEVEAAMGRKYQQHDIDHAARVLGVDVARQGDDSSVIFPRQGLVAFKPHVMRNVTGIVGAGQVARVWTDWNVDACFIDFTGGFGASWLDQLANLNRTAIPVGFSEKALDPRYFNRRAEMYFKTIEWIRAGGALPAVPELVAELTQTTYTFKGDALLLEPKDVIKAKLGRSPDLADALVLTFAAPVASRTAQQVAPPRHTEKYDIFSEFMGN